MIVKFRRCAGNADFAQPPGVIIKVSLLAASRADWITIFPPLSLAVVVALIAGAGSTNFVVVASSMRNTTKTIDNPTLMTN
jgi:hypothetical protein